MCVCVCVCREHVLGVINLTELSGQDVGLMPPSLLSGGMSHASAACALLPSKLLGFVVK